MIAAEAGRVAGELASRGIGAGARVAIWVHDGPLWQAAFFGILRAGAVAVPLEASADPAEARDAAKDAGDRRVVHGRGGAAPGGSKLP